MSNNTEQSVNHPVISSLSLQSAVTVFAAAERLAALRKLETITPTDRLEISRLETHVNGFVVAHARDLLGAFVEWATILPPLKRACAVLVGPVVVAVLKGANNNEKSS